MDTIKYATIILFACIGLSSCSLIEQGSNELSCESPEINCDRFSYQSIDKFKLSVVAYSNKWSLPSPKRILSMITTEQVISIENLNESVELIESKPEFIFSLGQYLEKNNKPKEWLYVSEQAFIRSWNTLQRVTN
jgi:hypothetical protein